MINRHKKANILIIENQQQWINKIIDALKESNYSIDATTDPLEGIKKSRYRNYDLILMDYALRPVKSPLVLCKILSNNRNNRVVILATSCKIRDAMSFMKLGAFDFIPKDAIIKKIKPIIEGELSGIQYSLAGV